MIERLLDVVLVVLVLINLGLMVLNLRMHKRWRTMVSALMAARLPTGGREL